jgi:hypothetical protein
MSNLLTKEQILSADDLKREVVQVPEWGGAVMVSTMSGIERDEWESAMVGLEREELLLNARAKLAARCIVNADGSRMFTDKEVEALGKKSSAALDRVANVAQKLNALSNKDIEAIKGN